MLLAGKKAVVTGGNSGIGRAISIAYAKEGAEIFILARNNEKSEAVVREIVSSGGTACYEQCDLSSPDAVAKAIAKVYGVMGRIDILANVAGISPKKAGGMKITFSELDIEIWRQVISTNLDAVFYVSRLVARIMMEQGYGKIINMSSIVGLTGSEHGPASACYCVSKAAVISLTRSMAYDLAPYGITVNAVAPGRIGSDMSDANNEMYNLRNLKDIPMRRFGKAEEVADMFVFYASDKSSYITGETTLITGGWLIR